MTDDEKLVKRVNEHAGNLNQREIRFVASCVNHVFRDKKPLSQRQREILEQIDDEKAP